MALNQGVPNPGYPLIDNTGKINPVWFQFLVSLWQRTGGGANTGNVQSVAVNGGDGIIATTTDETTNAVINLTLGEITPSSITTTGQISGGSGFFYNSLTTLGPIQFGQYVAGAPGATGYITISDANGTSRQILVA